MKYLFINQRPYYGPWGGGAKAINALHERASYFGVEIVDDVYKADTILVTSFNDGDAVSLTDIEKIARKNSNVRAFVRVNDCNIRKEPNTTNVDAKILDACRWLNGVIFVSEFIRDYFQSGMESHGLNNFAVIVNGVDRSIFRPRMIPSNHSKIRIVSHHWSDNNMKSGVITERVDSFVGQNEGEFEFTFVGRTKCKLKHAKIVPPLSGKALGDELQDHDVYFSESLFDPGPNHIIEAISSGLPTYVHENGGGAVDFAGADHTYSTSDELIGILTSKNYRHNVDTGRTWDDFVTDIFDFLKK